MLTEEIQPLLSTKPAALQSILAKKTKNNIWMEKLRATAVIDPLQAAVLIPAKSSSNSTVHYVSTGKQKTRE